MSTISLYDLIQLTIQHTAHPPATFASGLVPNLDVQHFDHLRVRLDVL